MAQLLGRAVGACSRLLNQQVVINSAVYLCFTLAVNVLLRLPLEKSWYMKQTTQLHIATQQYILKNLSLLMRYFAVAAVALGPAADAGPRAVAAMACAAAFDAISHMTPCNIASVLTQALNQGYGLCFGASSTEAQRNSLRSLSLQAYEQQF